MYYLVQSFRDGVDRRRARAATNAGALWLLENAHITPGGDIEKRMAFVDVGADLSGTHGLAAIDNTAFVFGVNGTPPKPFMRPFQKGVELEPNTIVYMPLNLQGNGDIKHILDWEVFDGRMYVAVETTTGAVLHFYDGEPVTKGRGRFLRTYKSKVYGVSGTGVLDFSGIDDPTEWNEFAKVGLAGEVATVSNLPGTPVYGEIYKTNDTGHFWQYTNKGWVDLGTAMPPPPQQDEIQWVALPTNLPRGPALNDCYLVTGNLCFYVFNGNVWSKKGQSKPSGVTYLGKVAKVTDLPHVLADGLIIGCYDQLPIHYFQWSAAAAKWDDKGTAIPAPILAGTVPTLADLKNPAAKDTAYKVTADQHYYIWDGTKWVDNGLEPPRSTTEETGAGFIKLSTQDTGSTKLNALEIYYDKLAVFSENSIQFWAVDADPRNNQQTQILRNTGTIAPQSPKQYGDGDVLFLHVSGIRSLRARNSSNAAGINDVGSAIDKLIQAEFADLGREGFAKAFSMVHPLEGRFWMCIDDRIYVLSYFPGPKVSAWSVYLPGFTPEYGTPVGTRIALRSKDRLYIYGGMDGHQYDDCRVLAVTPFLNADKPATFKNIQALDILSDSEWEIHFALDARNPGSYDFAGVYDLTTYSQSRMAINGFSPYISLALINQKTGPANLAQIAIHYEDADAS